jgi:ATP-dependent DNA helicase RecG
VDLATPVTYVKGVGPQRAEALAAKGIATAGDLLFYAPFRYEDRTNVKPLARLAPGEMASVIAVVESIRTPRFRRGNLGMVEVVFQDGAGGRLLAKWFHAASYLAKILEPGARVALYGKVDYDTYSRELSMMHPEYELLRGDDDEGDESLHTGRIVPVYEAAGKVSTRVLRSVLKRLTDALPHIPDPLPDDIRRRLRLPALESAIREVHFPTSDTDLRLLNSFRSPAQYRLIFEEFFWLETGMALKHSQARTEHGIAFSLTSRVRDQVKKMLPFKPTPAQKKVLSEIAHDMAAPVPMNRLLQGDVGSGKTIVAAQAAVIAVENGYQAVLLAPTEILAAQHFLNLQRIFKPLDYRVMPLTGSMSKKEKETIKRSLSTGFAQIAVGTHALLEQDVEFHKLGLAIIDEQHRFGVLQRKALQQKGFSPDVLVMTATPIPRTLALTIYGDLDVSVIDGLPPGRKPIQTIHKTRVELEQVYSFVLSEVRKGRQAYIVYPAIEESETVAMKAAQEAYEELSRRVFPQLKVGLLHGKLPAKEKEAVMAAFQRGVVQVLVTTTVIEVGVDVPNASVMVIEDAERFGLAQIHQLRGRVGRGSEQSYCVLVTSKLGDVGYARIRTLLDSSDGFYIAEMDLRLRGPGEFLGTKQSGLPVFRIGNLIRDSEILELARGEAQSLVLHPPSPEILEHAVNYVRQQWQRRYGLALVG